MEISDAAAALRGPGIGFQSRGILIRDPGAATEIPVRRSAVRGRRTKSRDSVLPYGTGAAQDRHRGSRSRDSGSRSAYSDLDGGTAVQNPGIALRNTATENGGSVSAVSVAGFPTAIPWRVTPRRAPREHLTDRESGVPARRSAQSEGKGDRRLAGGAEGGGESLTQVGDGVDPAELGGSEQRIEDL
jgi:hypothetical protein